LDSFRYLDQLGRFARRGVAVDDPGDAEPANRDVIHISLRVVRDKKLVTLIDVPVKTPSASLSPVCTVYRNTRADVPSPETYIADRSEAPTTTSILGVPPLVSTETFSLTLTVKFNCWPAR